MGSCLQALETQLGEEESLWSPCVRNVQLRTKPVGETMLVVEEGAERVLVAETGEECFEMMSSGHDRAVELTDSPQLWLSA